MRFYEESKRGMFQDIEGAKQLVSFNGMLFEGRSGRRDSTPTDVDFHLQLDNENCIILAELKYAGDMPNGQRHSLMQTCGAIQKGGTDCILLLAEHQTPKPEMIMAKYAVVKKWYRCGRWHDAEYEMTLYEAVEKFIDFRRRKMRASGKGANWKR